MEKYTQANRPLAVTTPLGEDAFLLAGLQGHEGVSQLFSFQLDLLKPGDPPSFDRLLGQPATVRIEAPGSSKRYLNGIVSRLTQKSRVRARAEKVTFIRYRMELVPRLWLLTRRFQTRILQHLSVPDILRLILHHEWRLDVVFRIEQSFAPRVRCVQYRETDFAFVSRLMEEEGIHYFFEHSEKAHQLIVSDSPLAPPDLQEPSKLIFDEVAGGHRDEARVTSWEKTQQIRSYKYTLWDHCFEIPSSHLEASTHLRETISAGKAKHRLDLQYQVNQQEMLEIYEYPGSYSHRFDGIDKNGSEQPDQLKKIYTDNQRTVNIRIQQEATQSMSIEGTSNVGHLLPGHQFSLERHFDADGPYRLTRVEHSANLEGTYLIGEHEEFHYENRFWCLPVAIPYRPPSVTPRPTVAGTQTATVVGPAGSEIHCDKYGRVKVQFHWDRTDIDKTQGGNHILHDSSCWVRVSQAWAGKGFGALHIPRVGQDVIVDFLEGDPDKPIIVGTVYNGEQMPPFTLPQHRTHAGLKTHTRAGSTEEFSHLTFEDYPDSEHVHLHSEQDMTHSAEQHLVQNVGQQHHLHIGSAAIRQVGGLPGMGDHASWVGRNAVMGSLSKSGGSGSGGGSGWDSFTKDQQQAIDDEIVKDTTPDYSFPSTVLPGWAQDLDTAFGWKTGNTVGLYTTLKVGANLSTTFNPFALEDFFPASSVVTNLLSLGGLLTVLGAPFRFAMGASNVVIGANTSIHYGAKIDVTHGNNLTSDPDSLDPNYLVTTIAGTIYHVMVLLEVILPQVAPKNTPTGTALAAADAAATLLALNVWAGAEAECTVADVLPKFSESLLASIGCAIWSTLPSRSSKKNTEDVEPPSEEDIHGPALASGNKMHSVGSSYTVCAPSITLLSSPGPTDAEDPAGIVLQANGLEGTDGEVVIFGTGKASLIGGDQAVVQCVTEEEVTGKVTIDCGEVGTIALQSGLAQEPNCILLNPEGISLTSLLEVKASVEENSVTLNPAMISLASGASSISITPEGITLSCGPASIAITPEGVTISGPTISVSGDALVEIG